MRTKQAVAAFAVLLALAATSCDDGDGQAASGNSQASAAGNGGQGALGSDGDGTDGDGTVAGGGEAQLASVAGADELIRLISNVTTCESPSTDPEDTTFTGVDDTSSETAVAQESATNAEWGIEERATCDGEDGSANGHQLIVVSDMARFEAAFKARQEEEIAAGEGDTRTRWFVGKNFAARIYATDSEERDMLSLGTLGLNCAPGYTAPPNSTTQDALVDGCVLTDFVDA
ncbi:hypothetical protein [Streptomyces sp. NPDC005494]|jgi:hypothetical protein|uniref:hypothetical protein n=1 Tax=unclassified Streptomyces TaxID=2593676 RepID=UPI0036ABA813